MKLLKIFVLTLLGLATGWLAWQTLPLCACRPQGRAVLLGSRVSAASFSMEDIPTQWESQVRTVTDAVNNLKEAGLDTLYFTVNQPDGVSWRSAELPVSAKMKKPLLFRTACRSRDVLALAASLCARERLKLVAVVDIPALLQLTDCSDPLAEEFCQLMQQIVEELQDGYALSGICLSYGECLSEIPDAATRFSACAIECRLPLGVELAAGNSLVQQLPEQVNFAVVRIKEERDAMAAATFRVQQTVWWLCPAATEENLQLLIRAAYYRSGQLPEGAVWMPAVDARDTLWLEALQHMAQMGAIAGEELPMPEIPNKLEISYPADGQQLIGDAMYMMGSCEKGSMVTVNGVVVPDSQKYGVFGVLLPLQPGENTFTVMQGKNSVSLQVTRIIEHSQQNLTEDGSVPLPSGSAVQITDWIANIYADPYSTGQVIYTARQRGIGSVTRSVQTQSGGVRTYAYELACGGWVFSSGCDALTENAGPYSLSLPEILQTGTGKEETVLVKDGTPLCLDSLQLTSNVLSVILADTVLDPAWEGATFSLQGEVAQAVTCQTVDGGVQLTVQLVPGAFWGYDISYRNGDTVLLLTGAPTLQPEASADLQPLTGISVMLDPGHGGSQHGALGLAGEIGGPYESLLNSGVAKAAAARLRQLGATVILTRQQEETVSLEQRSQLMTRYRPDVYVSIHHNSIELTGDGNLVSGVSAYYNNLQAGQLAQILCKNVSDVLERQNDGASWAMYYVTRNTYTSAVLLELGYLVNPAEYAACCDKYNILRTGDAIAQGILDFLAE